MPVTRGYTIAKYPALHSHTHKISGFDHLHPSIAIWSQSHQPKPSGGIADRETAEISNNFPIPVFVQTIRPKTHQQPSGPCKICRGGVLPCCRSHAFYSGFLPKKFRLFESNISHFRVVVASNRHQNFRFVASSSPCSRCPQSQISSFCRCSACLVACRLPDLLVLKFGGGGQQIFLHPAFPISAGMLDVKNIGQVLHAKTEGV